TRPVTPIAAPDRITASVRGTRDVHRIVSWPWSPRSSPAGSTAPTPTKTEVTASTAAASSHHPRVRRDRLDAVRRASGEARLGSRSVAGTVPPGRRLREHGLDVVEHAVHTGQGVERQVPVGPVDVGDPALLRRRGLRD